jgi:hypothetical protein
MCDLYFYILYFQLETDFETLYPGCNLKLYLAWPKLSAFIIDKVQSKAKNRLNNVFTPGRKNILFCHNIVIIENSFIITTVSFI